MSIGQTVSGLSPEGSVRSMVEAFEEFSEGLNIYLYMTNEEVFKRVIKELTMLGWIPK
ncbi:MAG: hypothetical protein QN229_03610 [Desulfurococcaceae archaeon TW002]